ncbi:MAG: endolytic transglycosylase MltG [SAR324 cluster bacterium]|nr:endolytic transglycosylase MltG [SAR324 cluster bacterium]
MTERPGFIAVFGAVAALCVAMGGVFLYGEFGASVSAVSPVTIEVKRGESLTSLAQRLHREGVLQNPGFLRVLAILRGDTGRIKAGEYVLTGSESPSELLDFLVSGKAKFISLTVPEGFSVKDVARRIERIELGNGERLIALARDPEFIASLHLPFELKIPTLEGMLFPETYYIHRGVDSARLLTVMVKEYKRRAQAFLEQNAHRVNLSPYQVLILASIIEKETGLDSERNRISAVFHNRLKARMLLGSDPTVIYGIENFDGNLTRSHLRTASPYNTYKKRGLPPTPIANPGWASLKAAVMPARVDYLYFVGKGDGSHYFSSDLKTHNRAVWKYQKRPHRKRRTSGG